MNTTLSRAKACSSFVAVILVIAPLIAFQPAWGHHGTRVAYDWTDSVRLTGVVTEFVMKNPHSFLLFDVTDEDGNVVNWGAEMAGPQNLGRIGITREKLQPGVEVEISLYPSRAGAPRGQHIVQEPLLINGVGSKVVGTAATPALTIVEPAKQPDDYQFNPRDLTGVWYSNMRRSFMGENGPWVITEPGPMTAEGQAKYESQLPSFGPRSVPPGLGNDPWGDCNPPGLTRTLLFGDPTEFVQTEGKVVQLFETTRVWRNIPTDGRALPEDPEPLWYGHSVGRWDGDTLVIETTGFDDRMWLDSYANPISDAARLVERWTRVDYATLELEMTLHDPRSYTEPIISPVRSYRLEPETELIENVCAPLDEYTFNEKIRDPASGRGIMTAEDWEGDTGYEEGDSQRAAYERDLRRMRSEDSD